MVQMNQEYSMDMNQHNGDFYLNKVKRVIDNYVELKTESMNSSSKGQEWE